MKSTFKTKLCHLVLSITFDYNFWKFHLDVLHLTTWHNNRGHHEKKRKNNLNNTLLLLLGNWPKLYGFNIPNHLFLSTFPSSHPPIWPLVQGAEEPILLAIMNEKEFERESCDRGLCALGISSQSANFMTLKDVYFKIYMCFKQPHFYTVRAYLIVTRRVTKKVRCIQTTMSCVWNSFYKTLVEYLAVAPKTITKTHLLQLKEVPKSFYSFNRQTSSSINESEILTPRLCNYAYNGLNTRSI